MDKNVEPRNTDEPAMVVPPVPGGADKPPVVSVSNEPNTSIDHNVENNKIKKDKLEKPFQLKKLDRKKLIAIVVAAALALIAIIGTVFLCINAGQKDEQPGGDDIIVVDDPEPEPEPLENTDPLADEPDEINPDDYQVAAYKPRFLSIPSLGLYNIPVTEVGWINGNQLGSPKSTRVAGWFYRSAIPGERGPAIINAHGGDLGTGIFKTLPRIQMGDEIIIEMGDGRKFTYIVGEIVFTALGEEANRYMNKAFQTLVSGVPSLSLITCTGRWLPDQQTYDQRLYVRASMQQ